MESPLAVANYFIQKSLDTGKVITPMKLIKLVYIAHGWHLGLTGEPLLSEGIQAWQYGPVIPSIYNEFKKYRNTPITALELDIATMTYPIVTDSELKQFLDKIWDTYSHYDGIQLSAMTHQSNTPWDIVWNREGGNEMHAAIIRNNLIETHYKDKIKAVNAQRAATATT